MRIEDFRMLPREPFERAVNEVKEGKATTPYQLALMTEKEKVVAFIQLTKNTLDTLETYLKTKQTSKYLFSLDHRDKPITQRQLNYCLKKLWERSFPKHKAESKNIYWHLLRKYLITSMLNQKIDTTVIKLIVGKSVGVDLETYLQRVNLSEEFVKVLPFVELGNFIAVQPRTLEQQRQRELVLIETIKILKEKLEKLTGETIQITIPVKTELPSAEELADLLNGNGNNHS